MSPGTGGWRAALRLRAVRFIVGPGLLWVGGLVGPVALKVVVGLIGFVLVGGSNIVGDQDLERSYAELRQADARDAIRNQLQNTVSAVEGARPARADRSLRACVMLYDAAAHGLRIAYRSGSYSDAELTVTWSPGQGCAGEAFQRERTIVAPQDGELPVDTSAISAIPRPWGMTPTQMQLTSGIGSVLSVPINDPQDHSKIIGTVNLDDSKPLAESCLDSEEIGAAVEGLADQIGELLKQAGTDIP